MREARRVGLSLDSNNHPCGNAPTRTLSPQEEEGAHQLKWPENAQKRRKKPAIRHVSAQIAVPFTLSRLP
jgi:hypothetical protein